MGEPARRRVRRGPGRVLALAYAFFTLAAGARSGVQLVSYPHRALFAYLLSAVAAGVYATGVLLMVMVETGRLRRAAVWTCAVELTGVLGVGALSLLRPRLFPDQTVWSGFGSGYAFVPLVLPVLALVWLARVEGDESPVRDPIRPERLRRSSRSASLD